MNLTPDQHDIFKRALEEGMLAPEHAFATVVGEKVSPVGLEEAFSDEGREHLKLIAELGNSELAAKLKAFSYEDDDQTQNVQTGAIAAP